jgi:hypothetical protein
LVVSIALSVKSTPQQTAPALAQNPQSETIEKEALA